MPAVGKGRPVTVTEIEVVLACPGGIGDIAQRFEVVGKGVVEVEREPLCKALVQAHKPSVVVIPGSVGGNQELCYLPVLQRSATSLFQQRVYPVGDEVAHKP